MALLSDLEYRNSNLNGCRVHTTAEALALLEAARARPAFFCSLEDDSGSHLLIGVEKTFGCIQHSGVGRTSPYMMVVNTSAEIPIEPAAIFLTGGTPTEIPRRYCVPWAIVRTVIDYFLKHHGGRDPSVTWEEI